MKAVMLSLRPQWCEKIFNGSKSIEVRKSRPSIPTPFKVYVYQTKHNGGKAIVSEVLNSVYGGGKVIGSFVCDDVITDFRGEHSDDFAKYALLSLDEQKKYGGNKLLYGWHITEPKLFDKPRELGEFSYPAEHNFTKRTIKESREMGFICHGVYITRPPQSWCYIETNER